MSLESFYLLIELKVVFDLLPIEELEVLYLTLEGSDLFLSELQGDAAIIIKAD